VKLNLFQVASLNLTSSAAQNCHLTLSKEANKLNVQYSHFLDSSLQVLVVSCGQYLKLLTARLPRLPLVDQALYGLRRIGLLRLFCLALI